MEAEEAQSTTKRNVVLGVLIVAVVGGVLWFGSQRSTESHVPASRHVRYEVEGTAEYASLTMQTSSGGTSQQQDVDVPLVKKTDGSPGLEGDFPAGAFVYISAQNGTDSGTVTCRITVDGVKVAENTSSGAYAIASCSGHA